MEIFKKIDGIKEQVFESKTLLEILSKNGFDKTVQQLNYYRKYRLSKGEHYISENGRNYYTGTGVQYLLDYLNSRFKYYAKKNEKKWKKNENKFTKKKVVRGKHLMKFDKNIKGVQNGI